MKPGSHARIPMLTAMMISTSILVATVLRILWSGPGAATDPVYRQFMQWVAEGRNAEALELGDSLLQDLLRERPDDSTLVLLAGRLDAAGRIRAHVVARVQPDRAALLEGIAGMDDLELPPRAVRSTDDGGLLMTPAREMYWAHIGAFAAELNWECFPGPWAAFLRQYYDLCVRDSIMKIGRHVVVTDPNSSEHRCHAIVLPLLYLYGRDHAWDQMTPFLTLFPPEKLDEISMFVLLQTERPEAAQAIARFGAGMKGEECRATPWAFEAASACVASRRPDLAERLLRPAAADLQDRDAAAELRLKIADGYARCADYATAARTCESALVDLPGTSLHGRIVAAQLGYLAKDAATERMIAITASVVDDPRCRPHLGQILYLRWWALRRANRSEDAVLIAQRLLEQYPEDSCIAPVLLERAIDALANQDYGRSRELLLRLTANFAGTESAGRAQAIIARLEDGAGD